MQFVRPNRILRWLYQGVYWRGDSDKKEIFLTFDDGPIPEVTPWVLNLLKEYNIKATFFCVGENVLKNADIFKQLLEDGHEVGNHTYHHINSWKYTEKEYFESIDKAQRLYSFKLFRPPHGKVYPWNIKRLKTVFNKIVMWDVLTYDYDTGLSHDEVFNNLTNNVRNGSVIVFHDSIKAWPHLEKILPKSIEWLKNNNYQFNLI